MPPAEQQHGCKVLHLVQREGYREPALAQAALLHDVGRVLPVVRQGKVLPVVRQGKVLPVVRQGKVPPDVGQGKVLPVVRQGTRPQVPVWHRVAAVLLRAIHPRLLCAVASGNTGSWRYPFWILLHHAAIGAELAAEANTDPLAVALISLHHTALAMTGLDAASRVLLGILQAADERI
jgi:hypothetical protein